MPNEPKRRHSKARQGKRRAAISLSLKQTAFCPNCGKPTLMHRACMSCGYYEGKPILQKQIAMQNKK